jgi:hypothetical protein
MGVLGNHAQKPYFEAWLKRTRRQLAPSGRLSEIAWILSREDGSGHEEWRLKLRGLLEDGEIPSLDLLMKIDSLLAGSKPQDDPREIQPGFF